MARIRTGVPLTFAAMSKALRAEGVVGAEEPGVEHGAASKGPGARVVEPSGRPPLSAVLAAVQSQVPKSAERDRVLDAGRHLASGANQKAARSLASKWGVRQRVGGVNRGTTDILNEVQDNVRRAAERLLQKEEVREEGAEAVAREEYAAEVSVNRLVRQRCCFRAYCDPIFLAE